MKKKSIWINPKGREYVAKKATIEGESFIILQAVKELKNNNYQVFESHQKLKAAGWIKKKVKA